MAEATAHNEVPADHRPFMRALEPSEPEPCLSVPTRQERDDHDAAGHVPYRSWCRVHVWLVAVEATHT